MIEVILASVVILETVILVTVVAMSERRKGPKGEKSHPAVSPDASRSLVDPESMPHLTEADLEQLRTQARQAFQRAVDEGATTFHADLQTTSEQLNKLIVRITTDVVERELEEYRTNLKAARENALNSLQEMQTAVDSKRKDLEADLDAELVKRREALSARIDQKLGAAAAAYIVASLGQGADLGAQRSFMLESLERHKEDLKKEIKGGA